MNKHSLPLGPARSHDIQTTIAIIILIVFVVLMIWYVQVAPLPHGVKAP